MLRSGARNRAWSASTDWLRLIVGENPLEVERLWYRMYRGSIYYGRRGVAIQAISAIDIALWDICGKAYGQPIHVLLGRQMARHGARLCQHAVPSDSRGDA